MKNSEPREYAKWCGDMRGQPNENYKNLKQPEKEILHRSLLVEQGYICAYTMRRIGYDNSHIEHIKPEAKCRKDLTGSDLYYQNLLACYPKNGMKEPYRYGAQAKGCWWKNEGVDFISPLDSRCEIKLSFNLNGEALGSDGSAVAQTTIDVLRLNHSSLVEDRKRAIREFIYGHNGDNPLSPKQVEQKYQEVCLIRSGQYLEFCVAIRQALIEYKDRLEKAAKRKKFAQQNKPK